MTLNNTHNIQGVAHVWGEKIFGWAINIDRVPRETHRHTVITMISPKERIALSFSMMIRNKDLC